MNKRLEELQAKFKQLESDLLGEMGRKEKEFHYEIRGKKVHFQEGVARGHKLLAKTLFRYWREARLSSWLTTPAILSCIIPVALMDVWATVYQRICFPAYGIPLVRRQDYIVMDRHHLRYLNGMERINCSYCGYVNGAIAYVQEIAGRTEQHWCPIKHAFRVKTMHSRYGHFLDYGDAEEYRRRIEQVRRDFADLEKKSAD